MAKSKGGSSGSIRTSASGARASIQSRTGNSSHTSNIMSKAYGVSSKGK